MPRQIAAALMTCAAITLTAASAYAEDTTLALFTKNQTDPIFHELRLGAEKAAKRLGVTIVHYTPVKPNNLAEQTNKLEDVAVRKPQAILYMPVDPKAEAAIVNRIAESGIPIINVLERSPSIKYTTFVGQDDAELGYMSAHYLLQKLGNGGNLIVLEGPRGNATTTDRQKGFLKAIGEAPGFKIIASQPANHQRLLALQVTENLIQRHPKIDGVLAMSDVMSFGAIEALQAAGRTDTKVVGIDGVNEAMDLIKQDKLLGTAQFNGFAMGCLAVEAAVRTLKHEQLPKDIAIDGKMITKDNVETFAKPAEQRDCPVLADYIPVR